MKTVIVVNPAAGAGQVARHWPAYNRSIGRILGPAEVCLTRYPGHATALVRQSLQAGFRRIVVVGGDGTLNECVGGVLADCDPDRGGRADVSLVLYPAGFGGDFARGVGLRQVPLADALHGATDKWVDVGRAHFLTCEGRPASRFFINIASFGASGRIALRLGRTARWLGGRLGFWATSARTLLDYVAQPIALRLDQGPRRVRTLNTVAVANGTHFGGGMHIAPRARLDDGLLDVVSVAPIGLAGFVRRSRALYGGGALQLPEVRMQRGRQLEAEALGQEPVLLELDGEPVGQLPARFEILPQKLRFYAAWDRLPQI